MTSQWITPIPKDRPDPPIHQRGKPSSTFVYKDAQGNPSWCKLRWDVPNGKEIRPLSLWQGSDGTHKWELKYPPAPRSLFNLDQFLARPDAGVLFVEGEKTAIAAASVFPDYLVTTTGGSNSSGSADLTPLHGRCVVLFPDNDEPGRKHCDAVAEALYGHSKTLRIVQLPADFPNKWDLADALPDGWDRARLRSLLDESVTYVPLFPTPRRGTIEQTPIAQPGPFIEMNLHDLLAVPPPPIRWLVPGLIPFGMEGILAAPAGLGKSRFLLDCGVNLACGLPVMGCPPSVDVPPGVIFYSAEDGQDSMARRLHALMERLRAKGITPRQEKQLLENLILLGPNPRKGMPLLANELDWLIERADRSPNGIGLIVVDTLSRVNGTSDENNAAANSFVINAMTLLTAATKATVTATHHLTKDASENSGNTLHQRLDVAKVRGSGAFIGGARFVLMAGLLNQTEATRASLSEERAFDKGYVVLSLSKFNEGPHNIWSLLQRVPDGEPGAGYLDLHPDSARHLAPLQNKGAVERMENADKVLVAIHRAGGNLLAFNRLAVARQLFPDNKKPDNAFNKAVGELRKAGHLDGDKLTDSGLASCRNLLGDCSDDAPELWNPIVEPEQRPITLEPIVHAGVGQVPGSRNIAEQGGTSLVPQFHALGDGTTEQGILSPTGTEAQIMVASSRAAAL